MNTPWGDYPNILNLNQLLTASEELERSLKSYLEAYKKTEDNINIDSLTIEEKGHFTMLYHVERNVSAAYALLKNYNNEVKAEGQITKNSNGRYEVGGVEIYSSMYIEYFGDNCYVPSRIEHNGDDYYIVSLGNKKRLLGISG